MTLGVKERGGSGSPGMQRILDRLRRELGEPDWNKSLGDAFLTVEAGAQDPMNKQASEILREIWARGPQHAAFRRSLRRRWNNVCAVHGVPCNDQLRASHRRSGKVNVPRYKCRANWSGPIVVTLLLP